MILKTYISGRTIRSQVVWLPIGHGIRNKQSSAFPDTRTKQGAGHKLKEKTHPRHDLIVTRSRRLYFKDNLLSSVILQVFSNVN